MRERSGTARRSHVTERYGAIANVNDCGTLAKRRHGAALQRYTTRFNNPDDGHMDRCLPDGAITRRRLAFSLEHTMTTDTRTIGTALAVRTLDTPTISDGTALADHVANAAEIAAVLAARPAKTTRTASHKTTRNTTPRVIRPIGRYAAPSRFYSVENMPELAGKPNAQAALIDLAVEDKRSYAEFNTARKNGDVERAANAESHWHAVHALHMDTARKYGVPTAGY